MRGGKLEASLQDVRKVRPFRLLETEEEAASRCTLQCWPDGFPGQILVRYGGIRGEQ